MSTVFLTQGESSYHATLELIQDQKEELEKKLKSQEKIIIKVNFVSAQRQLATTPAETVQAFIECIKSFYHGKIIIAEEATIGNAREGFERFGFNKLASKYSSVETFDSQDDETEKVNLKIGAKTLAIPISKIYLDSPFTVSVTRAKTHDTVVTTLSIKNLLVGAINKDRFLIHQGKKIHQILAQMTSFLYPDFSIIDGVIGMEGNGPVNGSPVKSNWALSSFDPLAADSLASFLMGFDINDIGYLNLIGKMGKGKIYPKDQIEIIGPNPEHLVTLYQPHQTFYSQKQWR
jgi:uncharacterized protein (DUF362 family)